MKDDLQVNQISITLYYPQLYSYFPGQIDFLDSKSTLEIGLILAISRIHSSAVF